MGLRVGTTSGIYMATRAQELANSIKKLGYTLTRGVDCIELPADVAHEVPYTHGKEVRHMAKKQEMDINFHGDLQVPMCMPDRGDYRDAQDRIRKSLQSAVFVGSKYIDFHASLNIWLELLTYGGGRKLTITLCDHHGRFIRHILKESKKLREWFVKKRSELYLGDILKDDIIREVHNRADSKYNEWYKEYTATKFREELNNIRDSIAKLQVENPRTGQPEILGYDRVDQMIDRLVDAALIGEMSKITNSPEIHKAFRKISNDVRKVSGTKGAEMNREEKEEAITKHLERGEDWDSEELRAVVGIIDGYHIMAHYLFYEKDPIWLAMVEQYKDLVEGKYGLDYSDFYWLDEAWKKANENNDKEFREFFYAVVGAKFLEGHMQKAFEWLDGEFSKKVLPEVVKGEEDKEEELKYLRKVAKEIIIGIENPDARQSEYAGMFLLWRPNQIYAAVKTIRKNLKMDRLMMIIDHEHLATQGLDALLESRKYIKSTGDFGELVISVHSNHPNPLHPHDPIEFGDVVLYELLYNLRITGLGKKKDAFLVFERGGGEDPFKSSIDALRIMSKFLETDTKIKDLPLEFYGLKGVIGDVDRQIGIIMDHRMDPLKDLFEVPEEEWGFLGSRAKEKGKAEQFKKGELR